MNRNLRLKNGRHWTIRHANPCPPDEEVAGLGPIDPEIGILRLDRLDGTPFAVVYNFACHPLWGDPQGRVTANYPGIASRVIEENLGHDAMAFFLQGAAGDIVDIHFKDFQRAREVESMGVRLGESALEAIRGIRTADAGLRMISEIIALPRRTDIPRRIAALREEEAVLLKSLRSTTLNFKSFLPLYLRSALHPECPSDYSYFQILDANTGEGRLAATEEYQKMLVAKYLENLRTMERLAHIQDDLATFQRHEEINLMSGESTISAEIQVLQVGEFVLVTAPLEPLVQIGLNVKKSSAYPHTFVAGFSNGYMHYGPPAADYDKGGYEVTECLLAPEWQHAFERAASSLIARLNEVTTDHLVTWN